MSAVGRNAPWPCGSGPSALCARRQGAYTKLNDLFRPPVRHPGRSVLTAEIAPYFALCEEGVGNVAPTTV